MVYYFDDYLILIYLYYTFISGKCTGPSENECIICRDMKNYTLINNTCAPKIFWYTKNTYKENFL